MSQVVTTRLPLGFPGSVTRLSPLEAEPRLTSSAAAVAWGEVVRAAADGSAAPLAATSTAADVLGVVVRPQMASAAEGAGNAVDVLRAGYVAVRLRAGTAAAGGAVHVRIAAATAAQPVGGVEAQAEEGNTLAVTGATFTGAAAAGDLAEIRLSL